MEGLKSDYYSIPPKIKKPRPVETPEMVLARCRRKWRKKVPLLDWIEKEKLRGKAKKARKTKKEREPAPEPRDAEAPPW